MMLSACGASPAPPRESGDVTRGDGDRGEPGNGSRDETHLGSSELVGGSGQAEAEEGSGDRSLDGSASATGAPALPATDAMGAGLDPADWNGSGSGAVPESQDDPAPAELEDDGGAHAPSGETCTFEMYNWSVTERRGVNHQTIEKPRSELAPDERDPNDPRCSICREDQVSVDPGALGFPGVDSFRVCWAYRDPVERALRSIADSGRFALEEIVGYRPGRTRGEVVDGVRTELSNHSYGTAVDINAGDNGLYGSCDVSPVTIEGIATCSLRVGGEWNPESRPRTTVTRDGVVYEAFTDLVGWRWGGEIDGGTRDLMHFSITGY